MSLAEDRDHDVGSIVPTALGDMMKDPDKAKVKRVAEEMLKQVKLDVAKLEVAFRGN